MAKNSFFCIFCSVFWLFQVVCCWVEGIWSLLPHLGWNCKYIYLFMASIYYNIDLDRDWHFKIMDELPLFIPLFSSGTLRDQKGKFCLSQENSRPTLPFMFCLLTCPQCQPKYPLLVPFQYSDGKSVRLYSLPPPSFHFWRGDRSTDKFTSWTGPR